jgi:hypothetical protein
LRLALSKGPSIVGVSFPSPEDGNRPSFRSVVFSSYLEFWAKDEVHKTSDPEQIFSLYSENRMEFLNAFCGKNADFFSVKADCICGDYIASRGGNQ